MKARVVSVDRPRNRNNICASGGRRPEQTAAMNRMFHNVAQYAIGKIETETPVLLCRDIDRRNCSRSENHLYNLFI